jgi:hypothetical protein
LDNKDERGEILTEKRGIPKVVRSDLAEKRGIPKLIHSEMVHLFG